MLFSSVKVSGTPISTDLPKRHGLALGRISKLPTEASTWMGAAFVVALGTAAIVLAIFGVGERGTDIALRATARWSFLLFWLAYAGGALATLFGSRLTGLARQGRNLGLAFASAQLIHVGLVLWVIHIAAAPDGSMLFFWVGIFCTYVLACFSLPWLRDKLGQRLWRILCTITLEYIALVFAADFILIPLQEKGPGGYPLSYVPFVLMLAGGLGLRLTSVVRHYALRAR